MDGSEITFEQSLGPKQINEIANFYFLERLMNERKTTFCMTFPKSIYKILQTKRNNKQSILELIEETTPNIVNYIHTHKLYIDIVDINNMGYLTHDSVINALAELYDNLSIANVKTIEFRCNHGNNHNDNPNDTPILPDILNGDIASLLSVSVDNIRNSIFWMPSELNDKYNFLGLFYYQPDSKLTSVENFSLMLKSKMVPREQVLKVLMFIKPHSNLSEYKFVIENSSFNNLFTNDYYNINYNIPIDKERNIWMWSR